MALAGRELRPRARVQLPRNADHGRRRALHHGRVPARRRRDRCREWRNALDVSHGRGRPHGVRAPGQLGPRSVVLEGRVRRADLPDHARLPSGRTGCRDRTASPLVWAVRRRRLEERPGPPGGPDRGDDRIELPSGRLERRGRGRCGDAHGAQSREQGEHPWLRTRIRCTDRGAPLDLPHHSSARRARTRYVGE